MEQKPCKIQHDMLRLVTDEMFNNFTVTRFGHVYADRESYDVWAVSRVGEKPTFEAHVYVRKCDGLVRVVNHKGDSLFHASMGDLISDLVEGQIEYASTSQVVFATFENVHIYDLVLKDEMNTVQWEPSFIRICLGDKTAATITRTSPVTLTALQHIPQLPRGKKCAVLMTAIKSAYSIHRLHELPHPCIQYDTTPGSPMIPVTTQPVLQYILSNLREVKLHPTLNNCQGTIWASLIDLSNNTILVFQYTKNQNSSGGTLEIKDTYGQTVITGVDVGRRQKMVVYDGCGKDIGAICTNDTLQGDFFDANGERILFEEFIEEADLRDYNETMEDNPTGKYFEDEKPLNSHIKGANGKDLTIATIIAEANTTAVKFLQNCSLKIDYKILTLAHAWKVAYYQHCLFRLALKLANTDYVFRACPATV